MFTGLVESLGRVSALSRNEGGMDLWVAEPAIAGSVQIGESVAINGACLTVVETAADALRFQLSPETLHRTNLGQLHVGDRVNLERSLRVGDRLGGHFVQGHVDGVGAIARRERTGDWETVWFHCPRHLAAQLVSKGSVAVDGVSLTVVDVREDEFSVALIPHTLAVTTLGFKKVGDAVNLEIDILAKYIWKYLETIGPRHG